MKISDLIKKLEKIKKEDGDLYVVTPDYNKNIEPSIYVSRPEEGEEDSFGTLLVVDSY